MPQTVRNRRLRSIREGRAKILVATDVAARGLDVPTISHVINFGLPMKNEDYVHRIGCVQVVQAVQVKRLLWRLT